MDWSCGTIWTAWRKWSIISRLGWHAESRREVLRNGLTLVECIRLGRTSDALLALDSGANPNSEDQQRRSVLSIAISLGNTAVIKKLLRCGADMSTHYPNVNIVSNGSLDQGSASTGWIKRFLLESLFRVSLTALSFTRLRNSPLLNPFQRFFPIGHMARIAVSRQPVEPRQVLGALFQPAELFCLLHLGSSHLGGLSQRLCTEALQSWSFRSCILQAVLLIYIQQFNQFIEAHLLPMQPEPYAPGDDALKELFAYTPDGSEMAILLLENGIDLGSPTQIGGQGHKFLLWGVSRRYTNVVEALLRIGVPAALCLPELNESNGYLHYRDWYGLNRGPVLIRAAANLQKDMVSLLLEHTTGTYAPEHLTSALIECAQAAPTTDSISERNEIIGTLLNCGADPNANIHGEGSLLSYLCGYMGNDTLVLRLLSAGANATSVDSAGKTALHHACYHTQEEDSTTINILLDAGVPVNAMDKNGHTALWWTASWGRPHTVLQLVQRGADVDLRGEGSTTPLMEACVSNGIDVAQALLTCGADPNACTSDDTALLAALRRKNPVYDSEIVQVLLGAGASPVLSLDFPRQPLAESVYSLKGDWTVAILQAAQIVGTVPQSILDEALKATCLSHRHFSIRHMVRPELNNYIALKAVKALIDAGGDPLSIVMNTCTALHAICQSSGSSGDEEGLLKTIVERGVSLDVQDQSNGRTSLHLAVQSSKPKTVEVLLKLSAAVDAVDLQSQTPLHLACQAKRREWTRYSRFDLGEAELETHPQFQGRRGEAAGYFELRSRRLEVDRSAAEEDIVEYLLDYGANPIAADKSGFTSLHYACEAGNSITAGRILRGNELLRKLRERPAKRNYLFFSVLSARDVNGQLPLHCAARSGNVEVVRLLLSTDLNQSSSSTERNPLLLPEEQEEDHEPQLLVEASTTIVNAVDNAGYTALHWAAKEGHKDVVLVLLMETSVVDVTLVSTSGHTALGLAAACDHSSVVEVLETRSEFYYHRARSIIVKALQGAAVNADMTDKTVSFLRQRRESRSVSTST